MIEKIEAYNRGVSVTVALKPGSLRVRESYGSDVEVDVRSINTLVELDLDSPPLHISGRGVQVLKSGGIGTRERTLYSLSWDTLPKEIRTAIAEAARKEFRVLNLEDWERLNA